MKLDSTNVKLLKAEANESIRRQKFGEALSYYQRICEIQPKEPSVWWMIGNIYGWMGDMSRAEEALHKALGLQPDYPDAHCSLGNALSCQNRFDEAVEHYRRALELNPEHPEAENNLATVLDNQGRSDEAEVLYRSSLSKRPTANTYYNLANTILRQGRAAEAISCYEEALALNPRLFTAHNNLGNALYRESLLDEAEACYREALRLKPDYSVAQYNLATTLKLLGRLDEAMAAYNRTLEFKPGHIGATAGKAGILENRGDYDAAYDTLKPLLDRNVEDPSVALVMAALCRHRGNCRDVMAMLKRLLQRGSNTADQRDYGLMYYALGGLLDEAGRYDEAFDCYQRGNRLKGRSFDREANERFTTALIETFTPAFLAGAPRAGHGSERPVFIVGMPRSGTSLVEQILASHPAVYGAGELLGVPQIVRTIPINMNAASPYPQCLTGLTSNHCNSWARRYLDELAALSVDALRITDKMPSNFVRLGVIALLFPQARIIHCVRDPRDTCLSCYFQNLVGRDNDYCTDLENLGSYYRQYERLMDHWKAVLDLPMLEISYENLVADQEAGTRALVEFCGLQWDERCMRFNENPRFLNTASYDQVRRPLYQGSVNRWRHYEAHLQPLNRALGIEGGT